MYERAFVLIPLLEMPEGIYSPPDFQNTPLIQHLDKIFDKEGVRLWKQINGEDVSALFANLKGYTQEGLAKELGISISVLGEVERGNADSYR